MTLDVDTKDFDKMIGELAAVCSVPPDKVLREEVGRVLSQAIKNTTAADVASIKRHADQARYSLQPASLYAPKRRRASRSGRLAYNLSYRYPDRLWAAIQKARAIDLKRRIGARGLAKQSWYKLGLMLGLNVEAPAYVKRAVPRTGKTYKDEATQVTQGKGNMAITIQTNQPTLTAIGGEVALQRAIDGRTKFFIQNVLHGVFEDMAARAKKYPGVI